MKKILFLLIIAWGSVGVSHATWVDFYMQTTGNNLNSGSTTSDSAAYTSTNGGWSVTSSTYVPSDGSTPASSVHVGDFASIYNDAATTAVYIASVTAVAAGVNGMITLSAVTFEGTAPVTATSGKSIKVGGAWANGLLMNSLTGNAQFSIRVNIKAGTYSHGSTTISPNIPSATTNPGAWWRGYKTTPGDEDNNAAPVYGVDIPTFTFTTGSFSAGSQGQIFSNLAFTSQNTGNGTVNAGGSNIYIYRCAFTNTASGGVAFRSSSNNVGVVGSYFTGTANAVEVVNFLTSTGFFIGNTVSGGVIGINAGASMYINNVVENSAGDAISVQTTSNVEIIGNSIYAPLGNGINFVNPTAASLVMNNHFENVNQAGKAAIKSATAESSILILAVANSYYNCTTNLSGLKESFAVFDVGTVGGSGFVNPTNHDYTPTSYIKSIGFPGAFMGQSYTGYMDNGAVQGNVFPGGNVSIGY